jgi:NAD(P)-dependent dehydrogenase (short-subunit alcohol dehydrogenase family)
MPERRDDLHGLTALITGATSGIGRASADALARDGASVIIHGRDAERGRAAVEQITHAGGQARFAHADLSDADQARRLAAEHADVDILVNNAGIAWFGPTPELDVDTFDALFDSNVRATYYLVAGIGPRMAQNGGGSIINIGSMAGEIGMSGGAAYGATKACMDAMTRSWAAEFSPHNVRVNTIASGPVYTGVQAPEQTAAVGETTILARAAQPQEIAEVVAFLAGPRASYLTGATVAVDGGRTAV